MSTRSLATILWLLVAAGPATASDDAPISGPVELLALHGAGPAILEQFVDGVPLDSAEREPLLRTLYACRRFTLLEIDRWKRGGEHWKQCLVSPATHRGQLVELAGQVVRVTREPLDAATAERFEMPAYFRCELLIGVEEVPAVVFTLAVPQEWALDAPLGERVGVRGLFLKAAEVRAEGPVPVLAAQRLAWYPDSLLGDLGMDAGLFDTVRHRTTITAAERECFYQLLAAARQSGANALWRHAGGSRSVVPLFNEPQTQLGRLVALEGTARRAVLIRVADPDIVERFGIDHYYEVSLFTPDSQGNPLVVCVAEMPPGLPVGDDIYEPIRVAGFFMKVWGYRIGGDEAVDGNQVVRQLAPLLVGRAPLPIPRQPVDSTVLSITFSGLFVLSLVTLWAVVWYFNRTDRRFYQQTIARQYAPDEGASLNDLGLNYQSRPDFSRLE